MTFLSIKAHRESIREQQHKRKKEERLSSKNYFGIKDLTPMNAINNMISLSASIQYK